MNESEKQGVKNINYCDPRVLISLKIHPYTEIPFQNLHFFTNSSRWINNSTCQEQFVVPLLLFHPVFTIVMDEKAEAEQLLRQVLSIYPDIKPSFFTKASSSICFSVGINTLKFFISFVISKRAQNLFLTIPIRQYKIIVIAHAIFWLIAGVNGPLEFPKISLQLNWS